MSLTLPNRDGTPRENVEEREETDQIIVLGRDPGRLMVDGVDSPNRKIAPES